MSVKQLRGEVNKSGPEMTRPRMTRLPLRLKATEIVSAWTPYGFWGVLLLAGSALHAQQTPDNLEKTIPFPIAEEWLLIPRIVATVVAYEPEVY
jgi:hypothetical protein